MISKLKELMNKITKAGLLHCVRNCTCHPGHTCHPELRIASQVHSLEPYWSAVRRTYKAQAESRQWRATKIISGSHCRAHLHDNKSPKQVRDDSICKKVAFTLAEVLITLGIIGVVAALTIPSLVQHYQKIATVNKIKKFYSNMHQVLLLAKDNNGGTINQLSSPEIYNTYIKPYIKNVSKVQTNIHMHGDFTGGVRFEFSDGTQAILSSTSNFVDLRKKIVLIYYTKAAKYKEPDGLDIKPTRERFYFVINEDGTIVPPNMNKSRAYNLKQCAARAGVSPRKTNSGFTDCSTVIMKDGWKISKDYPW